MKLRASDAALNKVSYALQVANGFLPSAIILALPRFFELREIGQFFVFVSTIGLFQIATEFGFTVSGIRECNRTRADDKSGKNSIELLLDITLIKAAITLLMFLLVFGSSKMFGLPLITQVLCLLTSSLASIFNVNWFLFSYSKSHVFSVYLIIIRIPVFYFIMQATLTPLQLALLWFFPQICAGLFSMIYIFTVCADRIFWSRAGSIHRMSRLIYKTSRIFFTSSALSFVNLIWPILFNNLNGSEAAAIYGFADKIVRGIMMLFTPIQLFLLALPETSILPLILRNRKRLILMIAAAVTPQFFIILFGDAFMAFIFPDAKFPIKFLVIYMTVIYFLLIHLMLYVHMVKKELEVWHAIIYISILPLSIGTAHILGNILYTPLFQEFYFVLALAIFFRASYHTS